MTDLFKIPIILLLVSHVVHSRYSTSDDCRSEIETLNMEQERTVIQENGISIHITCSGSVDVTKCEGTCVSRAKPSAKRYRRFEKNCRCCAESRLEDKVATLGNCHHGNQQRRDLAITVHYKQPADCRCAHCSM